MHFILMFVEVFIVYLVFAYILFRFTRSHLSDLVDYFNKELKLDETASTILGTLPVVVWPVTLVIGVPICVIVYVVFACRSVQQLWAAYRNRK